MFEIHHNQKPAIFIIEQVGEWVKGALFVCGLFEHRQWKANLRKDVDAIIFNASAQDGLGLGTVGSGIMTESFFRKSSNTQSITLMIKWGGLPSFLTVPMQVWSLCLNYMVSSIPIRTLLFTIKD